MFILVLQKVVGVAGFKPTTSPTPRVCAIRLRYTPNAAIIAKILNAAVKIVIKITYDDFS